MAIVTLGEILIDMFSADVGRGLVEQSAFLPSPGGAPANVAVAARRLGADAAFIGRVGDDAFGHFLIDTLRSEGVETRGVQLDPETRTTMAFVAMPDADHAEFVFYRNPGADVRLDSSGFDHALLASARALHFGSLSLTHEPARSATLEAVRIARDNGALISFDVNYRPVLWPSIEAAAQAARAMLPYVHLLKINETELELLCGSERKALSSDEGMAAACQSLLSQGPLVVIVTLGPAGSFAFTRQGGVRVPGYSVDTVDAIGCGDAFIAAVLTKLVADSDWHATLTLDYLAGVLAYANGVGALTSLARGVIPALPTQAQVEEFFNHYASQDVKVMAHPLDSMALREKARQIRLDILETTTKAGSGHPSSSFSAVEIAVALFFGGILRYRADDPWWPERDRFIMSKGHAAPLLYAVLAHAGYFQHEQLRRLRELDSPVQGHPIQRMMPGVEATAGSLGQGLSLGIGHILGARLTGLAFRVWVLLGDGECQAGQIWEAAMAAAHFKCGKLHAVLDYNKYQETGPIAREMALEPLREKWRSFGWHVLEADGHHLEDLIAKFHMALRLEDTGQPSIIIAHTVKGKGVSFVEADYTFHGRALEPAQAARAREELNATR